MVCCGTWIAGAALNGFGGALDELGAALCVFAMAVGLPVILLALVCLPTSLAQYIRPRWRRVVFYLGILTLADMLFRGFGVF